MILLTNCRLSPGGTAIWRWPFRIPFSSSPPCPESLSPSPGSCVRRGSCLELSPRSFDLMPTHDLSPSGLSRQAFLVSRTNIIMAPTSATAPAIGAVKWVFVVSACSGPGVHCQLVPPGAGRRASWLLVSSLVICFVILFTLTSFAAFFDPSFQTWYVVRRGSFFVCGV